MNRSSVEPKILRDYLLGSLSDEDKMRQLEETLLMDDRFAKDFSIAEDNLIEEYLDGSLSKPDRERFERHFLILPERKQNLLLIENLRKISAAENNTLVKTDKTRTSFLSQWREMFALPAFKFAVSFLLVFGFGFALWRVAFYESNVDKGMAELRLAYRGQRPLEARTSGKFDYAPFGETRGSSQAADLKARTRAEGYLLNAAENTTDAAAHHALGLLYLTDKKIELALDEFNRALQLAPADAAITSDIGAALLEKARQSEREEKFDESMQSKAESLRMLNRALELDDSLIEALFNRALVLQKLPAPEQAKEAWEKYLEKDSSSAWAEEARRNLETLKQQSGLSKGKDEVLRDYLIAFRSKEDRKSWRIASQTKELVTGVMIYSQLARKFLEISQDASRKKEAGEILSAFTYLGELENKNANDPFFFELAHFYTDSNAAQRQQLKLAQSGMTLGYQLLLKGNWKQALDKFEQAKIDFADAGSHWESGIAEYQVAYCLSQMREIKKSNDRLLALSEKARQKNYKWLQTLADGWIGNNYTLLGEHSMAINYNRRFLKTAGEISDTYNTQKAFNQLANQYWLVGNRNAMLDSIYRGLSISNLYFLSPRQKNRNLLFAVESLYRFKFYDAAAALGREEVYVAENELNDNWLLHSAHNHLAMIYAKSGNLRAGLQEIETSFRLANAFSDPLMQQKLRTKTRLNLAHLYREAGDCREAVGNYAQVIKEYENTEFSLNKYEARKGKLLCHVRLQDDGAVKEEMNVLLKMFDENRLSITEESNRNTFFDQEQNVYDIATDYAHSRLRDGEQALNYAESSRARSLLGLIDKKESKASAKPSTLSEIQRQLPSGVEVLYYAVLADKILIWHISDASFTVFEQPVAAVELNEKIKQYTELLTSKSRESSSAAKELYAHLIEPAGSVLDSRKSLCIIADKALFKLPFASLISPQTNKYLIEDRSLLYAPSATVFAEETKLARQRSEAKKESLVSIGNPIFSRREFPDLANLPDAEREAREIAAFYDSAEVFVGREARKEHLLDYLDKADVIHFAGHYVADERTPEMSKLLFAESNDLTVAEIMQKRASSPRLMILSACNTGVESFYSGEGMIGSSRAFLAAGVPLVIGSQWSVDSGATAELMIKFHYYRKQKGYRTIDALRQAQIAMLRSENSTIHHPFYWAGFLPVGGYAESY